MHTVIVGAGFAGVKAALEISKRQLGPITLVSDEKYFLHHATLYATATGKSSAESVIPLADIFAAHPDVTLVYGTMTSIDPVKKVITASTSEFHYDTAIIAIGMVTSYFGITGMSRHSYGIKTLQDVERLREHIKSVIIAGKESNFVVVGAGPTGVELAGALGEYIDHITSRYAVKKHNTKIHIVEAAARILPKGTSTASRIVTRRLKHLDIAVHTDTKVSSVASSNVTLGGETLRSQTVIWTAGVTNNPFFKDHSDIFPLDSRGQVIVDDQLMALPHVYVLGDNAATKNGGMAWTAIANAVFIADHLARVMTQRHFHVYSPPRTPQSYPVGDNWAYTEWRGLYVSGLLGYGMRRGIEYRSYRQLLPQTQATAAWKAHSIRLEDTD